MWCLRVAKEEEKECKTANGSNTSSIEQETEDYYIRNSANEIYLAKTAVSQIYNVWFYDEIISEEMT